MKLTKTSGAVLAASAALLVMGGAHLSGPALADAHGADGKVKCAGINGCKGTGSCKTAGNECKGQNKCKGHGWVEATKAECAEKGGKVVEG